MKTIIFQKAYTNNKYLSRHQVSNPAWLLSYFFVIECKFVTLSDKFISMTPEAIQKSENIAILIPSLKKGGGEKQACLLARVLSEHYSVTMILSDVSQGFEAENVT